MQLVKQLLPINELMSMGKAFAESGMFPDSTKAAQAIVKIQAGQEMGISPFASMSGIHMIKGKPTIGANIMASCVKRSGKYNYKVKEMTDKICSIDFYEGDENIGNSSFSIEDAKKAGTQNLEKFPRNMLFARAISNGVKWFCPDVFEMPVYTPEEMNITEDADAVITGGSEPVKITIHDSISTVTDFTDAIQSAATLPELAKVWEGITDKEKYLKAKDKRKAELQKPLIQTDEPEPNPGRD